MGIVKNKDNSLIDRLLRFKMATNEPTNDYYSFIGGKKDAEPIEPEKEKKVEQTTTFEERFKHRFRDLKLLPPPPPSTGDTIRQSQRHTRIQRPMKHSTPTQGRRHYLRDDSSFDTIESFSDTANNEPKTDYSQKMILADTLRLINAEQAAKKKKSVTIQHYTLLTLILTNILSATLTGFTVYLITSQVKAQKLPTTVEQGPTIRGIHGPTIRGIQEHPVERLPTPVEKRLNIQGTNRHSVKRLPTAVEKKLEAQSLQGNPVNINRGQDEVQGIPGIGVKEHNYTVHIDLGNETEESEEQSWWNEWTFILVITIITTYIPILTLYI